MFSWAVARISFPLELLPIDLLIMVLRCLSLVELLKVELTSRKMLQAIRYILSMRIVRINIFEIKEPPQHDFLMFIEHHFVGMSNLLALKKKNVKGCTVHFFYDNVRLNDFVPCRFLRRLYRFAGIWPKKAPLTDLAEHSK
jgi:hypothetical protein